MITIFVLLGAALVIVGGVLSLMVLQSYRIPAIIAGIGVMLVLFGFNPSPGTVIGILATVLILTVWLLSRKYRY